MWVSAHDVNTVWRTESPALTSAAGKECVEEHKPAGHHDWNRDYRIHEGRIGTYRAFFSLTSYST